jgi:hypothetical protein
MPDWAATATIAKGMVDLMPGDTVKRRPRPRNGEARHRDILAGPTAQAPPDATFGKDPHRHLMITFSELSPRKAVRLSGRSAPGHDSGRSDAAFTTQQPRRHTSPQITTTHRPPVSPASPLNRPSLLSSAVARPWPNPHS